MDIIKYVKDLESAGMSRQQAEIQVKALDNFMSDEFATKKDLQDEAKDIRYEIRTEFANVRAEMKAEFARVRAEMKAEFANVRAEMRAEFANVRAEMDARFAKVDNEFIKLRAEMALGFQTMTKELSKNINEAMARQIKWNSLGLAGLSILVAIVAILR